MKLWAIVYLALRVHKEPIQLSDMLRFVIVICTAFVLKINLFPCISIILYVCVILFARYAREGHLSYYRLDHLVPSEVKLSQNDVNFLTNNTEITHRGMRRIAASMAKFIGIRKMSCPNLLPLISRYCQELALPSMKTCNIYIYINLLLLIMDYLPKMFFFFFFFFRRSTTIC